MRSASGQLRDGADAGPLPVTRAAPHQGWMRARARRGAARRMTVHTGQTFTSPCPSQRRRHHGGSTPQRMTHGSGSGRLDKPPEWWCIRRRVHESGHAGERAADHITDLGGVGGELRPGIVHRLDRGTSGLMVVAKNDRAHQELSRQVPAIVKWTRRYIALVWGVVHTGRPHRCTDRAPSTRSAEDVDASPARTKRRDPGDVRPSLQRRLTA